MRDANVDAAKEIERLRATYGDIVVKTVDGNTPPGKRGFWWGVRTGTIIFIVSLLLLLASIVGLRSADHEQRKVDAERANTPLSLARSAAASARLYADSWAAEIARPVGDTSTDPGEASERHDATITAHAGEVVARRAEWLLKRAEIDALKTPGPATSQTLLDYIEDAESSFGGLRLRAKQLTSNALFVAGILFLIAAFAVVFVEWVRQQVGRLAEALVSNAAEPLAHSEKADIVASGVAPVSYFLPRTAPFVAPLSLGRLALPAVIAASAAAMTIGTFSVSIAGRRVPVDVADSTSAKATLDIKGFNITLPAKTFTIPPENVVADYGSNMTTAHFPSISVQLPDVAVDRSYMKQVSTSIENYSAIAGKQLAIESALFEHNLTLQHENYLLTSAILTRPSRDEFSSLRADVERSDVVVNQSKAVLQQTKEAQERAAQIYAIQSARDIVDQNAGIYNIFFKRSLLDENCAAYTLLRTTYPSILHKDGCPKETRLEKLRFWERSQPAFVIPIDPPPPSDPGGAMP